MRPAAWMHGLLLAAICLMPIGCSAKADKDKEVKKDVEPEPEVKIEELVAGTGTVVERATPSRCTRRNLRRRYGFENTVVRQEPFLFRVGRRR